MALQLKQTSVDKKRNVFGKGTTLNIQRRRNFEDLRFAQKLAKLLLKEEEENERKSKAKNKKNAKQNDKTSQAQGMNQKKAAGQNSAPKRFGQISTGTVRGGSKGGKGGHVPRGCQI